MELKKQKHRIQRGLRSGFFFLLAGAFLLTGFISCRMYFADNSTEKDAKKMELVLQKKERFLQREFAYLTEKFSEEGDPTGVLDGESMRYQKISSRKGIFIFYYEKGLLKYWSDHSIPLPNRWRERFRGPFVSLRNADYVTVVENTENGLLLGMIGIKTHFPYQNEFLVNRFYPDFGFDPDVKILRYQEENTKPVYNSDGVYLFSLDFSEAESVSFTLKAIAVAGYLFFILFSVIGFCKLISRSRGRRRVLWMGAILVYVMILVLLILKWNIPALLTNSYLFQPELFASRIFPSLGNLMVLVAAVLILATVFNLYVNHKKVTSPALQRTLAILLFIVSTAWFLFIERIIGNLVLDSNISFETYDVTTFTIYTFVGLLVIITLFAILGMLLDKGLRMIPGKPFTRFLYAAIALSGTILVARVLPGGNGTWKGWIALILILAGLVYLRSHKEKRIPISRFIFLVVIISIYTAVRLQQFNRINVERQREVELVKLSSEHDPVAEMLFSELSMAIRNDSVLAGYLARPFINIDLIINRLRRNYFSGYWTKYAMQVTVCRPDDQVYLQPPDDIMLHCYTFFNDMILEEGIQVANSDFYFMDNLNGRISYLASIPFFRDDMEKRLFIELDSKIISEELGYPELLLDNNYSSFSSSKFSYAKYNNGILIAHDGEYPYRRTVDYYTRGKEMFEQITLDGYDHSVYNVNDRNTIVVGSPSITLIDNLISFSYIFAYFFLLLAFIYLVSSMRVFKFAFNWNFKNRIQYSMAGILFFTFIFICSGTIYFIVQQYRNKHNDNLRNTMRSVYIELLHKLEFEDDLLNWTSDTYYNLDELLRKFSNVFYSDINLYDENGMLLATSRSEIFDQQLLSRRMNRIVFEALSREHASEYIHNEHIGELKYISAYVPLLNSDNKFLAYLNLPYFTQTNVLTQDVTNLVVAVLNIYVILLLVILLISVFLADRITQPLRVIQNRIAQVSLSEKNEKIRYDRSDEIRGLVEEYNYMVEELERSAELLAQSERESAWREMAKQIAHEIKNPLTPMKLNVQHLQRTFREGIKDPEMLDRIAATLIEQIDSLSAIANEFSDFAKMPQAHTERVNLVQKLKNVLQLFEASERSRVFLDLGTYSEVIVLADSEQLMRVFINLIKNGIQSIPEGREGKIGIRLQVLDNHFARITISDNGKGIPDEIKDKLFQPNFTTKSAGMGMGLAISSNIIKSVGGRIWYETEVNTGTTFFVDLPIHADK